MRFHGRIHRLAVFLILPLSFASRAPAANLDVAKLPIVQGATFEVVVSKPDDSSVRYEKPIPLDKLPFQTRNDTYNSIGTAFAIGRNRFVTAFHVIRDGIGGRSGAPALRDASGKVYVIDKVTGFSLSQDFVVFTVIDPPAGKPLDTDTGTHLNEVVYAVGNALGTGVVIRDGLYTSDTPEDENGRWKWIRFSAAASPGNSGGPLLDKDGKAIGVVLRKSPNENLNYALPIGLVLNAPTSSVDSEQRASGRADFMEATHTALFRVHFDLPMAFGAFATSFQSQTEKFVDTEWQALLTQEDANFFPNGDGSKKILAASTRLDTYPAALRREGNGEWVYWVPSHDKATIPGNGFVDGGLAGPTALLHLRKPDDMPLAKLYADPATLTDLIFKSAPFTREVGDEKIKVTSLGTPLKDAVYVDRWQRRWQLREFAVPVADMVLQIYSLPVPDGYVVLMRSVPSAYRHALNTQTETLANMVTATYDGSFAQWKEFLQQGPWVPPDLAAAHITIDYGKKFAFATPEFSLQYAADLQPIEPNGEMSVSYGFLRRDGKVTLGIGGVMAQPDMDKYAGIRMNRHPRPFPDSPRDYQSSWKDLVSKAHPGDGQPYKSNTMSWVGTTLGGTIDSNVIYTVFYGSDANPSDAVMKQKLAKALKGVSVQEH